MRKKLVVGLIGQVCAGKSAVAAALRRRGAAVLDADGMVHGLYRRREVAAQVRRLFGDGVMDRQGRVDRTALGKLAFSDPPKLRLLTAKVVFPRARAAIRRAVAEFRRSRASLLVLDAPTLVEAGLARLCDKLVFVAAPWARRREWARARGWSSRELRKRAALLLDQQAKRRAASAVIVNDGTPAGVRMRVDSLLAAWGRER